MLDRNTTEQVKSAIAALTNGNGAAGAWNAMPALAELCGSGMDIDVDFKASEQVGAPVVIARQRPAPSKAWPKCFDRLTARQRQVAICLARGLPNKQIARDLNISVLTAKDHVHAILTRLGIDSRNKVAALVFEEYE